MKGFSISGMSRIQGFFWDVRIWEFRTSSFRVQGGCRASHARVIQYGYIVSLTCIKTVILYFSRKLSCTKPLRGFFTCCMKSQRIIRLNLLELPCIVL